LDVTRATWFFAATTVLGFATSAYLWQREAPRAPATVAESHPSAPLTGHDPWLDRPREVIPQRPAPPPTLPEVHEDTRIERRARRTQELAAMFGRGENETAEDYKARVVPLIKAGLMMQRSKVADMRKEAEAKAHVSPEQSKALDAAFEKTYGSALDYANKAVADGTLSPYERNVSGWLEVAGGLGTVLGETNAQIGKILDPAQVKALSESGFEWGEYLGTMAPWENLDAPPPPPRSRTTN
jgi:hypothetical protein